MTAKVEVHYLGGSVDIIPVSEFDAGMSDDSQFLTFDGNKVLLRADQVTTVILHEDVPEPEGAVEEVLESDDAIEGADKTDNDLLIEAIERVEKAIERATKPIELVRNPNPYDKHYPWVHWGSGRTETWPNPATITYNITAGEGQDANEVAKAVATNLSGYFEGSKEAYAGVSGETNTCNCESDPDLRCADHPHGFYL